MSKTRKDRSDIQAGNLEKKPKLEPGTVRNIDQTDARSDKELGSLQREYGEQAMKGVLSKENEVTDGDGEKRVASPAQDKVLNRALPVSARTIKEIGPAFINQYARRASVVQLPKLFLCSADRI